MIGEEPRVTPTRIFASALAFVYVLASFGWMGFYAAVKTLVAYGFILICIWFPDVVGPMASGRINRPSPPEFVEPIAWFVLSLPAVVWIIYRFMGI